MSYETEQKEFFKIPDEIKNTFQRIFEEPNINLKMDGTDFKFKKDQYADTLLELGEILSEKHNAKAAYLDATQNITEFLNLIENNQTSWTQKSEHQEVEDFKRHIEDVQRAHFKVAEMETTGIVSLPTFHLPGLKGVDIDLTFKKGKIEHETTTKDTEGKTVVNPDKVTTHLSVSA